jgi:cyclohexanecarboxylate-CoA ligase
MLSIMSNADRPQPLPPDNNFLHAFTSAPEEPFAEQHPNISPSAPTAFPDLRVSDVSAVKFRELGAWRDETPIDDLRRWRNDAPEAVAIIAHRADSGIHQITYQEYAQHVERFAGALYVLGVRSGQVVAVQLPNWWQVSALMLACARLGAVVAPILMTIRARELERVLARVQARVCVTTDRWEGFGHAAALAELAPRLPDLQHRAVLGASVAADEIDFVAHFQQTPWELTHSISLDTAHLDPDQVFLVLFTSGTSGEPKAAVHSHNTLHDESRAFAAADGLGTQDRLFSPHALTHYVGISVCVLTPLLVGAAGLMMDTWEPQEAVALAIETDTSFLHAAPIFLGGMVAVAQEQHCGLPALRVAVSAGTTIPEELVSEVPRALGVPLRTAFGTTEIGLGTMTRADDPPDSAVHSVGRPFPGTELDLRAGHEISIEEPARLFVRGGGICLATLGRDTGELIIMGDHDDGWYDTGDLAVPDGTGGIRLLGRASDRIGGMFMIPVADVEFAVRSHPAVADVALVGYPDGVGGELAAAVVVARSEPPTMADLHEHLNSLKMTEWYRPSRLELIGELPRNSNGKVQKELLRRWLRGETDLPARGNLGPVDQ